MRLPISIKLAIVILLILLLQGAALYWFESNAIKATFLKESEAELRVDMTSLQQTLTFLAQANEHQQLQATITALGADSKIKSAYLLDEHTRVIASTKVANIGKNVYDVVDHAAGDELKQRVRGILENLKNVTWYSNDRTALYAVSPVVLGRLSDSSLRSDRVGFLLEVVDLKWIERNIKRSLYSESERISVILFLCTIFTIGYLHFFVGRRIKVVHDAIMGYKLGHPFNTKTLAGRDELGDLSAAFTTIATQANTQHNALLENQRGLKKAQEIARLGNWQLDVASNKITWSDEVYRIFGVTPQEFEPSYAAFLELVHPDDRMLVDEAYSTSLREGRDEYEVEHRLIQKSSGEVRFVHEKCAHIRDDFGKIVRSLGMVHDITERKLAEQRIISQQIEQEQILNHMAAAVISIDQKGTILSFNASAEILFGFTRREATGHNVGMLMPDDEANRHDSYLRNYYETNVAKVIGIGREVVGRHKDGKTIPLRLSVAELPKDAAGNRRFIGTCDDMTRQKKQEELLRHSQKIDAIGKLTGGIAHDFNNILGVILGYADLLKELPNTSPKQAQFINEINLAGERAKRLTSKLLDFSRKKALDATAADLNTVIKGEQDLLAKTLTPRIQPVYQLADGLWPVWLDKSSLEDAILNIGINAMHAMPDGGTLTISTQNTRLTEMDSQASGLAPGDYVLLTLTDTGTGMDAETRQKVFDPFFTTKKSGTGLGLSQVHGFVKQSGGAIHVYSELGHGTRIAIYFPRYHGDAGPAATLSEGGHIEDLSGSAAVLVVDDEAALLELARPILSSQGYRVWTANDGEGALQVLQREAIDILVTDVIMPGMDGHELAAQVKRLHPNVKIQLASGFSDERHSDLIDPVLHQERLQKPYNAQTLLRRIKVLLAT